MNAKTYWVYILYCKNGTYYTGYTINMQKRYQSHVNGTGKCKYTRSFKPLHIAQCWEIQGDKSLAMQIERHIKTLSRAQKEKIIKEPLSLSADPHIQVVTKEEFQLLKPD
ncbi:MAG: GIY-YIG nuclease family protein [Gammaproteobacteria bacterium]|nr:GIY-YIG nuclease family protein [Gammaproteobacteria bacterium]